MKKENAISLYFLTRSLFFGLGISLLSKYTNKDTYIGAIIGTLLGFGIILIYRYIILNKNNESLNSLLKKYKLLGFIAKLLIIISSMFILIYTLLTYKTFVSNFLLITTPIYIFLIPWIILLLYCALNGFNLINKVAVSLFPLSLILSILSFFSTIGSFDTYNFLPVLTIPMNNLILTIISFAGISTFPCILSLHFNSNMKNYAKIYLLASTIIVLIIISINGVFGEVLLNVFRYPEYIILKQIKLLDFIEKVENILSIAWAFDLFITSAFSICSIKTLINKKYNNFITIGIVLIIMVLIAQVFDNNYPIELLIYNYLPLISLIFSISIIILLLIIIKKEKINNHQLCNKHL